MMTRARNADESEHGVPKAKHAGRCTLATPKDRTRRPTAYRKDSSRMLAVHHLDPGCLRQPAPIARDTLAVTGSVGWTTLCSVAD